ncbi:MAG: Gfo/Idh/MocA family oxidoreductase [Gemmatimonadales bacterium]
MSGDRDRRIRWGVLGTAHIGKVAVNPAIQASRNGRLVAIASRAEERARELASATGIPAYFGSYDALLREPGIDAVYVPLPNSEHKPWTIRAAEAGKHVLCEKPLGLSAAECREMDAAAEANGVRLMEAFMYRFHPRIDRIGSLVADGAIGELRAIRSAFSFRLVRPDNIRLRPELGGGALMDVGCYCVNLSRTVVGAEPLEAQAFASWTESGVDGQLAGTLRFPGGVVAQLDCALTIERREMVEVVGTEGSLEMRSAFLPGTGPVAIEIHRGRAPTERIEVEGADQYRSMVEHFADCVLNGKAPRYEAGEAALNLAAIEALYRSARSGGAVTPL